MKKPGKTPERPLVVLDRDGTLIRDGEYLKDPRGVNLLPGVPQALKRLKRSGFRVVVASNQSGVGRKQITLAELRRVNRRFMQLLSRQKARLDGVYWCPHAPAAHCSCRKPKLGMVRRAAKEL